MAVIDIEEVGVRFGQLDWGDVEGVLDVEVDGTRDAEDVELGAQLSLE